jgi:putative phosphoesterase
MRVGLISDIHANRPALDAVLADLPEVDEVVCAGDVVGYNPWPADCVDRVRDVARVTVEGNHDRNVETPERYRANRMAQAGLEHAREHLDEARLAWLRGLPERETLYDDRLLLVHSHPTRTGRYVYPDEFPAVAEVAGEYEAVVLGHTHAQHAAIHEGTLVCNPGSVGQPRDGDPRAAYAVLDTESMTADLHRVAYDVDEVREAVAEAGLPERTAARLARGE